MRSIASVARWAAYLLVAATMLVVIVACPEGPAGDAGATGAPGEPGKDAPTNQAPVGTAIPAQSVAAGTTVKVDLSTYFTDPEKGILTYVAVTQDTKYATVAIEGSMVTVTGVAEGTATVGVQATDSGGLIAIGTFTVTVTKATTVAPPVGTCGTSAKLGVGDKCQVPLTETQKLESGEKTIVTVALMKDSKTVWEVTAKGKGKTTVRIVDVPSGKATSSFDVTVENRPPRLARDSDKQPVDPPDIITMVAHNEAITGFPYSTKPSLQRLYRVVIPGGFGKFFQDQDGDAMSYTVVSKSIAAVVKSPSPAGFLVDVVSAETGDLGEFEFEVTATDSDKVKSTEKLTVHVNSELPRPRIYPIEQYKLDGAFRPATIGLRSGVTHYLRFLASGATGTDPLGADTANDGNIRLRLVEVGDQKIPAAASAEAAYDEAPEADQDVAANRAALLADPAATPPSIDDDKGDRYIKMSATGPISIIKYYTADQTDDGDTATVNEAHPGTGPRADIADNPFLTAADDSNPVLAFKIDGGGLGQPRTGTATITIEYYVVYDADGAADANATEEKRLAMKTLTLTIERVQE